MIKKYFFLCFLILYSQIALPALRTIGYVTSVASFLFAMSSEKKIYQVAGLGLYSFLAYKMISYDSSKYDRYIDGLTYIGNAYNNLLDSIGSFNEDYENQHETIRKQQKRFVTKKIQELLRTVNQNHPDVIEGYQEQEEIQSVNWDRFELIDNHTSFVFFNGDQEVLNTKAYKDVAINLLQEPIQRYENQYNKTISVFGLTLGAGLVKKVFL